MQWAPKIKIKKTVKIWKLSSFAKIFGFKSGLTWVLYSPKQPWRHTSSAFRGSDYRAVSRSASSPPPLVCSADAFAAFASICRITRSEPLETKKKNKNWWTSVLWPLCFWCQLLFAFALSNNSHCIHMGKVLRCDLLLHGHRVCAQAWNRWCVVMLWRCTFILSVMVLCKGETFPCHGQSGTASVSCSAGEISHCIRCTAQDSFLCTDSNTAERFLLTVESSWSMM